MKRIIELKRKRAHIILFISTIILILFFTFIVRETLEIRHVGSRGVCLTPFREWKGLFTAPNHWFYFWQIFLNILLFIPFGFMLSCNLYIQRRSNKLWLLIFLSGLLVSVSVELLQYMTSRGYTEIDDVINNSIGAMLGWFLYNSMLKAVYRKNNKI